MARKPKLWEQPADKAELNKLIRKHNDKIRRERNKLIKEGRTAEAEKLPENLKLKDVMSGIKDRRNYNRVIREINDSITPRVWQDKGKKDTMRGVLKLRNKLIKKERDILLAHEDRYEAAHLPETMGLRDVMRKVTTQKEYDKFIRDTEAYINDGTTYALSKKAERMLKATIQDFNSKVKKLKKNAKNQGERAALPEKLKRETLIRNARNNEELISHLKEYKGFLENGAEELVVFPENNKKITKWQKEWMEMKQKRINSVRDAKRDQWLDAERTFGGNKTGKSHREMGAVANERYKHINLVSESSEYRDIREKARLLAREDREDYWLYRTALTRENYLNTMEKIMGSEPVGRHLIEKIRSMPIEAFDRVLMSEDDLWVYLYQYEKAGDKANRQEALRKIWGEWENSDMEEWLKSYNERLAEALDRLVDKYE